MISVIKDISLFNINPVEWIENVCECIELVKILNSAEGSQENAKAMYVDAHKQD